MNTEQDNSKRINGFHVLDEFISLTPVAIKEKQSPSFTLALAHEIRNPLTNINLAVDILSDGSNNEQKILFDIIGRASTRINELIGNLLQNYEAKEVVLEISHVTLLMDDVLAMLKDRLTLKNILVTNHYTRNECKILINRPQIMLALINIIINAIDAMSSTKGELKLTTRLMRGTCIIEIEDNGIGISKQKLVNIFKPYFTDKPGGVGLGLSTSLTTLLSNHARVRVYSEEGKGTRFVLFFETISSIDDKFKNMPLIKVAL